MAKVEKLIHAVKNYPILYDVSNEEYKNAKMKKQVWNQIGEELGDDGEKLKRKWKNLRDNYVKYLQAINTKTESKDRQKFRKWQWASQMDVFRPFICVFNTESNVKNVSEAKNTNVKPLLAINDNIVQEESNSEVEEKNIFKESEELSDFLIHMSSLEEKDKVNRKKHIEKIVQFETPLHGKKKKGNNIEPIDLIFSGYAQTVKTFSPQFQVIAKLKVAELISQLEYDYQEKVANPSNNSYL
ncbi:hypothetical protein ABEB36_000538 [Hypothenemus hampei]|uniref:MADF domain-containing protein n=1 Tax=Hypothenemus hampei TaxID=57062 RepID=A0ABD1FBP0_HYPHA